MPCLMLQLLCILWGSHYTETLAGNICGYFWQYGGSDYKESACNAGDPGLIPWEKEEQPTPVFLPGEFHGKRSLVDYSLWGCKELGTTKWLTLSLSFTNFKLLIFYIILLRLHIFFPYPFIIPEELHFLCLFLTNAHCYLEQIQHFKNALHS